MTEATMPATPVDYAWRKRLAFRILAAIAAVPLGIIISLIFWSVVVLLLWPLTGLFPGRG
jgi:hypothetical protein